MYSIPDAQGRLVKAAGAESCGQRRNQKLHAVVARSTFATQNAKNMRGSGHFLKLGKLHAAVARSTIASPNVQNTCVLGHFWKLRCEAHLQVKMYKTHHVWTTCGRCAVKKSHAAVARSTFATQNVKNMKGSGHFLKLGCGKIAHRCSEKHICKSKCTKHMRFGPLFGGSDVQRCPTEEIDR